LDNNLVDLFSLTNFSRAVRVVAVGTLNPSIHQDAAQTLESGLNGLLDVLKYSLIFLGLTDFFHIVVSAVGYKIHQSIDAGCLKHFDGSFICVCTHDLSQVRPGKACPRKIGK
jgi:hypothetical protein